MNTFDHILNWKLKEGSHTFPGTDGGTCINEAAIVAAGFEYQPVHRVEDMPECFSRPICKLAMQLNDNANDDERQELLRFVTRLACADTPVVEAQRSVFIRLQLRAHLSFQERIEVLERALEIGREADVFPPSELTSRMAQAQASALGRATTPEDNLFSKIKSWCKLKQTEPA
jgi:hypothetical protein